MNDIRGNKCPDCDRHMKSINAEAKSDGQVQRRRECPKCKRRITTIEKIIHYGDGRKRLQA